MVKSIFFLLFITPLIVFSQEIQNGFADRYIESMQNKLNVKLELDNDIETFEFNDGNLSYSVIPNTSLRMSIAVNHDFLTLRVGFSPKFLADDSSEEKGSTTVFKINMDIFFKKWVQTFEVSDIKGYYIDDASDPSSINLTADTEYTTLPHLKTRTFRGITRYNFNDNFSFKAILNQNEIQRKSAGSFVPSFTYEYFKISDKTATEELKSVNLILNAGYFYTFVINKKLYANLSIAPGLGYGFNKLTMESEDDKAIERNTEFIFNMNSLIGLGYNSRSFFGGVFLRGIATTHDENSIVNFDSVRGIVKIFVGYRFGAPKFINKSFDWMKEKNPIK